MFKNLKLITLICGLFILVILISGCRTPIEKIYNGNRFEPTTHSLRDGKYSFKTNEHLNFSYRNYPFPTIYVELVNQPEKQASILFTRRPKDTKFLGNDPSHIASYDKWLQHSLKYNNRQRREHGKTFAFTMIERFAVRNIAGRESYYLVLRRASDGRRAEAYWPQEYTIDGYPHSIFIEYTGDDDSMKVLKPYMDQVKKSIDIKYSK